MLDQTEVLSVQQPGGMHQPGGTQQRPPRRGPGRGVLLGVASGVSLLAVLGTVAMHAQSGGSGSGQIVLQTHTEAGNAAAGAGATGNGMTGNRVTGNGATAGDSDSDSDHSRTAAGTHGWGGGAGRWVFRTIDDPKDPTFNQLLGINDHGRIVGYFGSGADAAHPNKGYRVRPGYGGFVDENVPGSAQTQVVGINGAGTTVGFFVDAAGANTGFVHVAGRFIPVRHPLTSTKTPFTQLLGINAQGVAVGFYNDRAGNAHGFTYTVRTATFAPVRLPVAADAVTATGINDHGDVSGFYTVGKTTYGFRLTHAPESRFTRLSFGNGANTQALGIDDAGELVGSYTDRAGTTHGFWRTGTRLVTVDDPKGAKGSVVNGLNDRGQLVGFSTDAAGNTHGFLATTRS